MPNDLRDALQLDETPPADLVIEPSVLISCVVLDARGDSWVLPYHQLSPSRFYRNGFELAFGDHLVTVGVQSPDEGTLLAILQAVAQWRLALLAHGGRFDVQVLVLDA